MKATTKDGFTCEIDQDALGDWEIVERLVAIQGGNYSDMPAVITELIGADGYQSMKDHVRNEKGRVQTEKMMQLFFDIMTAARETAPEDKKK